MGDLTPITEPRGPAQSLRPSGREVRDEESTTVTCAVPAGTDLSAFGTGASVKAYCDKRDGEFRLAYLESERAVIELER